MSARGEAGLDKTVELLIQHNIYATMLVSCRVTVYQDWQTSPPKISSRLYCYDLQNSQKISPQSC